MDVVGVMAAYLPVVRVCTAQSRENQMGGICEMHGGEERCIEIFGGETREQKTT